MIMVIILKNTFNSVEVNFLSTHHTLDEKLEAIHKILDEHQPVSKVAKELHVHRDTIYKWMHKFEKEGKKGLIDHRIQFQTIDDYKEQIKSMEREIQRLKKENEILKKFKEFVKNH